MKKIVVNARFLTQPITGVQRFAIELSKRLVYSFPDIRFVTPKNIIHKELASELQAEVYGRFSGHLWEQLELPVYLKKNYNPLLINFANTSPLWYSNQIITLHDLSFFINPKWFSSIFAHYYSYIIPKIAKNSLKIVTVSENSKKDINRILHIENSKIEVIYNGIANQFKKNDSLPSVNRYGNYILAVSSIDPRKNFRNLMLAFNQAQLKNTKLLIVGSKSKNFADQSLAKIISESTSILFTGYVTDEELITLYKNASMFIYPSLYEGFGIPPLEAMACGCPTIVSNTSSLPEVCGDASYYIDPNIVDSLVEGIHALSTDINLRTELILKGYERVTMFDWEKSVARLINVINLVSHSREAHK